MGGRIDMLDIFTVTSGDLRVGVDSAEIERVADDFETSGGREGQTAGRMYRLSELFAGRKRNESAASETHPSAFLVKSEDGKTVAVTFEGVMDMMKIPVARIMPISAFIQRCQKPLFVWGFYDAHDGLITLVTFQFLLQEGTP